MTTCLRADAGAWLNYPFLTAYERDIETGLDYAQARYYANLMGRFTSVDPLAASANPVRPQSWNRYSYSYNSPLRYTDPSGMVAGDFYNLDGKKIGTDGIDDGRIYVVYDKKEVKDIQNTQGAFTGTVSSQITIASEGIITAVEQAVTRSNNAPFTGNLEKNQTASGGFQEAGVTWKNSEINAAPNGPTADPRQQNPATISLPSGVDGQAHIHPSGTIVTSTQKPSGGGVTVMGGGTIERAAFVQPPSPVDVSNALPNGTNIVVGAGNKTVYFYKASGNNKDNYVAKMSWNNFQKLGRQK